jgi:hypothetical protein
MSVVATGACPWAGQGGGGGIDYPIGRTWEPGRQRSHSRPATETVSSAHTTQVVRLAAGVVAGGQCWHTPKAEWVPLGQGAQLESAERLAGPVPGAQRPQLSPAVDTSGQAQAVQCVELWRSAQLWPGAQGCAVQLSAGLERV